MVCPVMEVHFSPNGGCQDAIVKHIKDSKKSIRVQAYVLTNKPITEALVGAKNSGIDVQIILDASEAKMKYNPLDMLKVAAVPTFLDSKHAISHNKVMVFDESSVMTGSYNFSNAAEHDNAENCLFIEAISMAKPYLENWDAHKAHSTPAP